MSNPIPEDHFIVIFRFSPTSSTPQRGDDIYYVQERMRELLPELPHTESIDVCTLSSL